MKISALHSIKFSRLKRRLNLPHWQIVGVLESLWLFTQTNAPAGDIGRISNEDIAAGIEWSGDADNLVFCLAESGWLDRCENNRYIVHDWDEHCPNFIKGNFAKHGKKFVKPLLSTVLKQFAREPANTPEHGATYPILSKPNQAKTKPNSEIHSDASASGRETDTSKPKRTRKPKAEAKPREPWPTYDAIKAVTGCDGSHVARVAQKLDAEDPPYTPSEIMSFLDRFPEICPHVLIDGISRLPSVGEVEKYYPRLRMTAPALPEQSAKQPPKSFAEVRVEKAVSLLDQAKQQALEREARQALAGQPQPAISSREGNDHAA